MARILRVNPSKVAFPGFVTDKPLRETPPESFVIADLFAMRRGLGAMRAQATDQQTQAVGYNVGLQFADFSYMKRAWNLWSFIVVTDSELEVASQVGHWHWQECSLNGALKLWKSLTPFMRVDTYYDAKSSQRALRCWSGADPAHSDAGRADSLHATHVMLYAFDKWAALKDAFIIDDIANIIALMPDPKNGRQKIAECMLKNGSKVVVLRKTLTESKEGQRLLYKWQKVISSQPSSPAQVAAQAQTPSKPAAQASADPNKIRQIRRDHLNTIMERSRQGTRTPPSSPSMLETARTKTKLLAAQAQEFLDNAKNPTPSTIDAPQHPATAAAKPSTTEAQDVMSVANDHLNGLLRDLMGGAQLSPERVREEAANKTTAAPTLQGTPELVDMIERIAQARAASEATASAAATAAAAAKTVTTTEPDAAPQVEQALSDDDAAAKELRDAIRLSMSVLNHKQTPTSDPGHPSRPLPDAPPATPGAPSEGTAFTTATGQDAAGSTSALFAKLMRDSQDSNNPDAMEQLRSMLFSAIGRISTLEDQQAQPTPGASRAAEINEQPEFTARVDAHVTVRDTSFKTSKELFSRCLRPECNLLLRPGAEFCSCFAPASIIDLRCEACGTNSFLSLEQVFTDTACLSCGIPKFFMMTDAYERLKWRTKMQASKPSTKHDDTPPASMAHAFSKSTKIQKTANALTMYVRAEHDPAANEQVAPGAEDAYAILDQADNACSGLPGHNFLPVPVDFDFNVKIMLASVNGCAFGNTFDDDPTFQCGPADFKPKSSNHAASTVLVWSKRFIEAVMPPDKWDDKDAKIRLRWALDAITTVIRYVLSNKLADEHAELVSVIMAAHDADTVPAVDFDVLTCFKIHRICIAWWRKAMHSHLNKQSMDRYGDDLLWQNPGTNRARPLLYCRSFRNGSATAQWASHLRHVLFTPREHAIKVHAKQLSTHALLGGKAHDKAIAMGLSVKAQDGAALKNGASAPADLPLLPPPALPLSEKSAAFVPQPVKKVSFAAQATADSPAPEDTVASSPFGTSPTTEDYVKKNETPATATRTMWPSAADANVWISIPMADTESPAKVQFCVNCLCKGHARVNCTAPTHEHAFCNADGAALWHILTLGRALKENHRHPESIYKRLLISITTGKPNTPSKYRKRRKNGSIGTPAHIPIPSPAAKMAQWLQGEPAPLDMEQLELSELKSTVQLGARIGVAPQSSDGSLRLLSTRGVTVRIPSRAKANTFHEFNALAKCFGSDLLTKQGVQKERCAFNALAAGAGVSSSELFSDVESDCLRILDKKDKIIDKYEDLVCYEVVDGLDSSTRDTIASIVNPDEPVTYFFLHIVYPALLKNKCVFVMTVTDNEPSWQLYLPCSPTGHSACMDSEVIHLMAAHSHVYKLEWECGLLTLKELLHFLGKAYRFSDTSIHPCLGVQDTLNSSMPVVLDFLRGAEFLITAMDANIHELVGSTPSSSDDLSSNDDFASLLSEQPSEPDAEQFAYSSTSPTCGVQVLAIAFQSVDSLTDIQLCVPPGFGKHVVAELTEFEYIDISDAVNVWEALRHPAAFPFLAHLEALEPQALSAALRQLTRVLDTASWQQELRRSSAAVRHLACCCRDLRRLVSPTRWALKQLIATWCRPLTADFSITTRPSLHSFYNPVLTASHIGARSRKFLDFSRLHFERVIAPVWARLRAKYSNLLTWSNAARALTRCCSKRAHDSLAHSSAWSHLTRCLLHPTQAITQVSCSLALLRRSPQSQVLSRSASPAQPQHPQGVADPVEKAVDCVKVAICDAVAVDMSLDSRALVCAPCVLAGSAVTEDASGSDHGISPPDSAGGDDTRPLACAVAGNVTAPAAPSLHQSWSHLFKPAGSEAIYVPVILIGTLHEGQAKVRLSSKHGGLVTRFVKLNSLCAFDEKLVGQYVIRTPECYRQPESASQPANMSASASLSPIAAHQVDHSAPPLERYLQARVRAEHPHILNTESFCSWKERLQARHGNQPTASLRRSNRETGKPERWSPDSGKAVLEEHPSPDVSDDELQHAVGQGTVMRRWLADAQPSTQPPPPGPSQAAEFANALPAGMRLDTSAQIKATTMTRTHQSQLAWGNTTPLAKRSNATSLNKNGSTPVMPDRHDCFHPAAADRPEALQCLADCGLTECDILPNQDSLCTALLRCAHMDELNHVPLRREIEAVVRDFAPRSSLDADYDPSLSAGATFMLAASMVLESTVVVFEMQRGEGSDVRTFYGGMPGDVISITHRGGRFGATMPVSASHPSDFTHQALAANSSQQLSAADEAVFEAMLEQLHAEALRSTAPCAPQFCTTPEDHRCSSQALSQAYGVASRLVVSAQALFQQVTDCNTTPAASSDPDSVPIARILTRSATTPNLLLADFASTTGTVPRSISADSLPDLVDDLSSSISTDTSESMPTLEQLQPLAPWYHWQPDSDTDSYISFNESDSSSVESMLELNSDYERGAEAMHTAIACGCNHAWAFGGCIRQSTGTSCHNCTPTSCSCSCNPCVLSEAQRIEVLISSVSSSEPPSDFIQGPASTGPC